MNTARFWSQAAAVAVLSACGASVEKSTAGNTAAPAESDVRSKQVLGTWLFSHSEADHNDELLKGTATISDECLVVEGFIVIWHESRLVEAVEAVRAVKAGESVTLRVGGSLAESTSASAVASHCEGYQAWWGSPD